MPQDCLVSSALTVCCLGMSAPSLFNASVCRVERDPDPAPKLTGVRKKNKTGEMSSFVLLFCEPQDICRSKRGLGPLVSMARGRSGPTFTNRVCRAGMSLVLW